MRALVANKPPSFVFFLAIENAALVLAFVGTGGACWQAVERRCLHRKTSLSRGSSEKRKAKAVIVRGSKLGF